MTNDDQHIPSGYKPSPLGIIPEDWEVKRLGEIGEVLMCKRIMKYQTDSCGDIPFFKIGTFGGKPDAYISREVFDEYKAKYSYPKVGDVLISAAGTIGRSVIFDGTPSYYQDSNIVWIDNDNKQVLNKYLYYYYSTINWITDTGTIPRLYNGALKAIQIPTPPLEQQARVVSILELWDTATAKQTALLEQLTLRKRGLMQQLLTGKKRLKGFEGEWKEVRLGEICPMERGEMLTSDNYLQGNIPVIAGGKEPAGFHSYANRQKNTITISCSGASAGFVAFHDVPIFATDCFTISESNAYNVWFIYHVLTNLQEKIYKLQTGGAQPHVHPKDVYPMKIHIPSIKEQNVIASVLVNADKEIEIQKQKLAAMKEQKKGLMQVLLTGKKRIK